MIADRERLHGGSSWTYIYFLGGGFYFHYQTTFRFSYTQLPYNRFKRYHIRREITLHYVPRGCEKELEDGKVSLPSGHVIKKAECQGRLFKKLYKVKPGGLLAELYNIGTTNIFANPSGQLALASSVEEYNLNQYYSVADFHIQVFTSGNHPVHQWFGIPPGSSTAPIEAMAGVTAQNTTIQDVLPGTHLLLGLPTMLDDRPGTHPYQVTIFEATDNLLGYMRLNAYTPQEGGKVELHLDSAERQDAGGGSIHILIGLNGTIFRFKVYYNLHPKAVPVWPKYPRYFSDKRDDDYRPPPGGSAGMGSDYFWSPPVTANYFTIEPAYEQLVYFLIKQKSWFYY